MGNKEHIFVSTRFKPREGSVLVYLVLVMLILGILGAAMIRLSVSSTETMLMANSITRAQFLAEAGLRYAQAVYCDDPEVWDTPGTLTLLSGEIVVIDKPGDFVVTATTDSGGRLEATARVFGEVPLCDGEEEPEPGETPDDYVVYTGGGGSGDGSGFAVPSGGYVDGSVFGETVTIQPSGVEITDNVISSESVTLGSQTTVGGYICAADGNVRLRSSNTVVAGDIYAFGNVILESGTSVLGTIYATGDVVLQSGNTLVGGDIHAGGSLVAASAEILGSVYADVNVNIRNGTEIGGEAHAGNDLIYGTGQDNVISGDSFAGGSRNDHQPSSTFQDTPPRVEPLPPTGCPPPPPPPQLQSFTSGTTDVTIPQNGNMTLNPGTYGDVSIGGGATITLEAGDCMEVGDPGCYVVNSFGPASWGQTLRLDLSTGDYITVFSVGDIGFSGPIEVSTDGVTYTDIQDIPIETAKELAKRVYWETHGTFTISQDNDPRWFGTVLSEDGISLGSGFFAIGAFATVDGPIEIQGSNPNITFVIADFAYEHWLPD